MQPSDDMTAPSFHSSGDLIIDRRFSYAEAMAGAGDHAGAIDLLAQIVEAAPHWPVAWFRLGEILTLCGRDDEAAQAFARVLAIDPADPFGAALHLARLGAAPPPPSASQAYVRGLFDQYAGRFDTHLRDGLAYRGPELLLAAVATLGGRSFAHAIDLGCGTGLAGALFRPITQRLTGVDLSSAMIAAAREKALYDRLAVGEAQAFLARESAASADLLIAGDVLCYIGDLAPIFQAAHRVLTQGGLFAATLQKGASGFAIGADLRFAHAPSYLRETIAAAGFAIAYMQEAVLRRDAGADVAGLVVVMRKNIHLRAAVDTPA